ncbi:MAG TPA: glycoside hydrolase family 43 protein [Flavitalea sp.]|nr:glycoside hydrolase family 43 protein [Flavitalea sp.]
MTYKLLSIRINKKRLFLIAIQCLFSITVICQQIAPLDTSIINLADPTIFKHKNRFYLYGTVEGNAGNGFLVYVSHDLKGWKMSAKNHGYALKKGDAFGTAGFWAPQVFSHNNKFYMAYTANENIAIAESDDPAGPFKQTAKFALQSPVKQIDPFVFIDDDGKKYLYHVRLMQGNKIFVAEMTPDFSSIKEETLRECLTATNPWENTTKAGWPVTEGPTVLKRNGVYYLFYSANDFRNPDYAVGYATSKHPTGPWVKSDNPILTKFSIGRNGTGHGDFFLNRTDWMYVFHTHYNDSFATPRKTGLIKVRFVTRSKMADSVMIDTASFKYLFR